MDFRNYYQPEYRRSRVELEFTNTVYAQWQNSHHVQKKQMKCRTNDM